MYRWIVTIKKTGRKYYVKMLNNRTMYWRDQDMENYINNTDWLSYDCPAPGQTGMQGHKVLTT